MISSSSSIIVIIMVMTKTMMAMTTTTHLSTSNKQTPEKIYLIQRSFISCGCHSSRNSIDYLCQKEIDEVVVVAKFRGGGEGGILSPNS